jgi:prophage regulatory protein
MPSTDSPQLRLLRLKEVIAKTGISRSSIYAAVQAGDFPRPVKIGARSSAWLESEINIWIRDRITERDSSQR